MIYVLLAAVTVDPTNAVQAAAPWVEQAIGALVLSSLGALGWLIRNALRKMTEDAVHEEQRKNAEEKRAQLAADILALKAAMETQKARCVECHQSVDTRFSRGDLAIGMLRKDVATLIGAVDDMRSLLREFLRTARTRAPISERQDADPRLTAPLPRADEEG